MSQVELFQSVLQKLGQLPVHELADLDGYLSVLVKRSAPKRKGIAHLAGAWSDWNEQEFKDFLQMTRTTRQDMISLRQFDL